jgi:hypothetical protein
MKNFNPSNLTASLEEINSLDEKQLRELHKMYPTRKPYLKISYSNKNSNSSGYATYGSLVGLRPLKNNVTVVGIIGGATIAEMKVTSDALAPVRSLKVETPEVEETPLNEQEIDSTEPAIDAEAFEFAKAKYFEIHGKDVPKNKSKDLEWIQSKLS